MASIAGFWDGVGTWWGGLSSSAHTAIIIIGLVFIFMVWLFSEGK